MPKGKIISRTPATPRQIRDIRPTRLQLASSNTGNDHQQRDDVTDDGWWRPGKENRSSRQNNGYGNGSQHEPAALKTNRSTSNVARTRMRHGRHGIGSNNHHDDDQSSFSDNARTDSVGSSIDDLESASVGKLKDQEQKSTPSVSVKPMDQSLSYLNGMTGSSSGSKLGSSSMKNGGSGIGSMSGAGSEFSSLSSSNGNKPNNLGSSGMSGSGSGGKSMAQNMEGGKIMLSNLSGGVSNGKSQSMSKSMAVSQSMGQSNANSNSGSMSSSSKKQTNSMAKTLGIGENVGNGGRGSNSMQMNSVKSMDSSSYGMNGGSSFGQSGQSGGFQSNMLSQQKQNSQQSASSVKQQTNYNKMGGSDQQHRFSANQQKQSMGQQVSSFSSFEQKSPQIGGSGQQMRMSSEQNSNSSFQQQSNTGGNGQTMQQSIQGLRGGSSSMGMGQNSFDSSSRQAMPLSNNPGGSSNNQFSNQNNIVGNPHQSNQNHRSIAGLDCQPHGGPFSEGEYAELIYWQDIPSDATFSSPYYIPQAQEAKFTSFWKPKYLTFEMDDSGWNNARIGLENVILLAHTMGRTLVMPPKRQIAHMIDKSKGRVFSFSDFYDIDAIDNEQSGLNIISMETFLEREAGNLKSNVDGDILYPPDNQVKWDNQRLDPLWEYVRSISKSFEWSPSECVLAFPEGGTDVSSLTSMMSGLLAGADGRPFPHHSEFQGKPTRVDAPSVERLREMLAERQKLCLYDDMMHVDNDVVHFKADENDGTRLITQFYAFIWFEDWKQDLWAKRFIRDHLRYKDEIMCLAARVLTSLREQSRSPTNPSGQFDAVHIRRGDFLTQFPSIEVSANDIVSELQDQVQPNGVLFIVTDERDKSFFKPIENAFNVKYLIDFVALLSGVNPNFFGLVEQIVASRSRLFFGTYKSTFSSYIVRLRGYYSAIEKHEGYATGALKNTFFLPGKYKKETHLYQAIRKPFFARDFPVAWRDIDRFDLPLVTAK